MINTNSKVGEIVGFYPQVKSVFLKNDIYFCCSGQKSLHQICKEQNISEDEILGEMANCISSTKDFDKMLSKEYWHDKTLIELVNYIEEKYHKSFKELIPSIINFAKKVEAVHQGHENVPSGLTSQFEQIWLDFSEHIQKEKEIVFPLIKKGNFAEAQTLCRSMILEHDNQGMKLKNLVLFMSKHPLPVDACGTWTMLYTYVNKFISEMIDDIHLENNILYKKVLPENCCGHCS